MAVVITQPVWQLTAFMDRSEKNSKEERKRQKKGAKFTRDGGKYELKGPKLDGV